MAESLPVLAVEYPAGHPLYRPAPGVSDETARRPSRPLTSAELAQAALLSSNAVPLSIPNSPAEQARRMSVGVSSRRNSILSIPPISNEPAPLNHTPHPGHDAEVDQKELDKELEELSANDKYVVHWRVREDSAAGKYQQQAVGRKHTLTLDERGLYPGGLDSGPSPYDLVASALASCTSMTVRMYADRKSVALAPIVIDVRHSKRPADDVAEAAGTAQVRGVVDLFEVSLALAAPPGHEPLSPQVAESLLAIAARCPVHQTLVGNPRTFIRTKLA